MRVALGIAYRGSAYRAGRASPAAARCRTSSSRRCRAFADAPLRIDLRRPHRRRRARAEPGRPLRHRGRARRRCPGCAAPTATCRPTSPCSGAASSRDGFHCARQRASAGAMSTCCSNRRCGRRSRPAWSAGPSARSTATAMRTRREALVGEHDFSAFRSAECQAPSPVKTMRALAIERRGAYWRFELRRRCVPAPHGAQHHGLPGRGRQRRASGVVAGRGAGGARPRAGRADLRSPTASTSSARTTMRSMRSPSEPRPWTGCPDASLPARALAHEPAHPHQDLRPDARGRRRRGGRSRRRRDRLRLPSAEPALRQLDARRRAGARAAALRDAGRPVRQRRAGADRGGAGGDSAAAAAIPRRRNAGRVRRLRAAVPARRAHGAGARFARLRAPLSRRRKAFCSTPMSRLRRRRKGLRLVTHSASFAACRAPVVLSGGLHAGNVVDGILQLRPWAVDVSSGVESSPRRQGCRRDPPVLRCGARSRCPHRRIDCLKST